MRILVTGSWGHLGEALVRTLRDAPHEVVGLDVTRLPVHEHVGSITDRDGTCGACMRGVDAVIHAATLHKPHVGHPRPAGLRRHQRHGHAQPPGGGRRGRRRGVRVHEHDQRFGQALTPAGGCPRGVGDRGRPAGPEEHLRRDQDRGRGPVRAVPPPSRARRAWCCGRRGSSPRRTTTGPMRRGLRGREHQGERVPPPAGGPPGRRGRPPARRREGPRHRLRAVHRQRDHARSCPTTWPNSAGDAPAVVWGGGCRATRRSTPARGGGCSPASTGCT